MDADLRKMNDETLVTTGRMTAEVVRKIGPEAVQPEALADLYDELTDRLARWVVINDVHASYPELSNDDALAHAVGTVGPDEVNDDEPNAWAWRHILEHGG